MTTSRGSDMGFRIRSLATSGGAFDQALEFDSGLTCIIGGPGTGKSTAIETLRTCLGVDRERVALLIAGAKAVAKAGKGGTLSGLVRRTLGAGTVSCVVEPTARAKGVRASHWTVERDLDSEPRARRGETPDPAALVEIARTEVYSHGDLQVLAEDLGRRLDLVDRPHAAKIAEHASVIRANAARLREVGALLRKARETAEEREGALGRLPLLREESEKVRAARPKVSDQLEREHERFMARRKLLALMTSLGSARAELAGRLDELAAREPDFRVGVTILREAGAKPADELARHFAAFADALASAATAARAATHEHERKALAALEAWAEREDTVYRKLQKEQAASAESMKEEARLRQEIATLEAAEKELERLRASEAALVAERGSLRATIRRASDAVTQLREEEVAAVNGRVTNVRLELVPGSRSTSYRARLDALLRGSKLRGQEDLAQELATIPPGELVDAIEDRDADLLAAHVQRERDAARARSLANLGHKKAPEKRRGADELAALKRTAARVIDALRTAEDLYTLDGLGSEDSLEIRLNVAGAWTPIEELSTGQRAIALMPLILREADCPLVFDQPEDDLDGEYLVEVLVDRLRELKLRRQVILVTHSPLVVVVGEADRVVFLQRGVPAISGTVADLHEVILQRMEGGADAFEERRRRYGLG